MPNGLREDWKPSADILEQCNRLVIVRNDMTHHCLSLYLRWCKDDEVLQNRRIEFVVTPPWIPDIPEMHQVYVQMNRDYNQGYTHGQDMLNELTAFLKGWHSTTSTKGTMSYEKE